jgi:hypothetical protein
VKALLIRVSEKAADGYAVSLYAGEEADVLQRASDNAKPDATDTIPLTLKTTAGDEVDVTASRQALASADGTDKRLRTLGIRLYQLLARGTVGTQWSKARKAANDGATANGGVMLRTYLDIRDADLGRLPWELLQDGGEQLALLPHSTLTRFVAVKPQGHNASDLELRVLLVIGCDPVTGASIQWLEELRGFLATFCPQRHSIDFEVFEAHARGKGGLKRNLRETIEGFVPHILHFVGHGQVVGGDGALELFDASTGGTELWTSQELKTWLTPVPPRIVLLNACRTSAQAGNPGAPIAALASMSAAALSVRVSCVVAMQHDIAGAAAARFAGKFYESLMTQAPVDIAMVNGRKRIGDDLGYDDKNWALPVCTVGIPPEALLPRIEPLASESRLALTSHPELSPLSLFVDRRAERRRIIRPAQGVESRNLGFIVSEDVEMGKSSLSMVIAEWILLRESQVVYVDCFKGLTEPLNVIEFLRHVRGSDALPRDILRPRIHDKFGLFNATLNAVLNAQPVPTAPKAEPDLGLPFNRGRLTSEQAWEAIFDQFLGALRTVSEKKSLTIFVDHLSKQGRGVVFDDFREHIEPRLLRPVHRGAIPNVTIIIAATEAEVTNCGLRPLYAASLKADLAKFPIEDWELLAWEYAVRNKMNVEAAEETIKQYRSILKKRPWRPASLSRMKGMYEDALEGMR